MKVAHISDCYLPRLGGIEVQVTELTRRQAAAGYDVTVFTATPGEEVRLGVEELDGVSVNRVTARLPLELPVHPRTTHHLVPLLEELQPDVVHVHLGVISPFAWGGIRSAVKVGVPTIVTVHSVWGAMARSGYGLANGLIKWSASGVVPCAVSEVAAAAIRAAGDDVEVLITPNGVDPADWNAVGRVIPIPAAAVDEPVRFVSAMRLAPRKRAIPLLQMFTGAKERVGKSRRITLAIAGDGPHRNRLQKFIDAEGLSDDVTLLGRLTRPDLKNLYVSSDVFVQPSVKESFGLAALEARATGLPIVARSQTGLTEFVHDGLEGLLAPDDIGMASAMAQLAKDDALRIQIQTHNAETEPEQVWPNVLGMVASAYGVAIDRGISKRQVG
ncbi:MAG: glycosyltransferase family 4 protein [Actinomycetia bacterium]|nr:glycosyltransferase family 4 protein [Actinomycetes bacterium]